MAPLARDDGIDGDGRVSLIDGVGATVEGYKTPPHTRNGREAVGGHGHVSRADGRPGRALAGGRRPGRDLRLQGLDLGFHQRLDDAGRLEGRQRRVDRRTGRDRNIRNEAGAGRALVGLGHGADDDVLAADAGRRVGGAGHAEVGQHVRGARRGDGVAGRLAGL